MAPLRLSKDEGVWVKRLMIENFRSIARLDLDFRYRLTLLIGNNGAGKTTVLDALATVLQDTQPQGRGPSVADLRRVEGKSVTSARVEALQGGIPIAFSIASDSVTLHGNTAGGAGTVKAYFDAERSYHLYRDALEVWFTEKDAEEARQIRESRNLEHRDPNLEEIRRVIERMIPGTRELRIHPTRRGLFVKQDVAGRTEEFDVDELAGGFRTMLALVATLQKLVVSAKAAGNDSPKILVLIDEIDLHLHPRWQLDVVGNLLDAFPTAQFIMTTHSEEIVSAVPSECVVSLQNNNGLVVGTSIPPVQGATFDRVLEDAMGVPGTRPPEFKELLDRYLGLVDEGDGDTEPARVLRRTLDEFFQGEEPELLRADLVKRRKRAQRKADP
jgi:predicted ATP-binding protein involved in virulence